MKMFLLAAGITAMVSCNNAGTASEEKKETTEAAAATADTTGFVSLFDGKTTAGWHKYGGGPVGSAWTINNGELSLDTSKKIAQKNKEGKVEMKIDGAGNIVTDEEYENFHLKLEWKISPGGNSGILFYVHEDTTKFKEPYESGPEMQVLDNDGHGDGKLFRHRAGDLYDLINCSKETVKPAGEWNLAEIVCNNGNLDLILNGTTVVSTTMWDDNWNAMVAKSKFKEWPGFGTFKKGRICLQDHGNAVSFRNIQIKKL
ncbi:MAG: DUF1080 domain-containing protein [Sphingobacteriales bacterium]